MAAMALVLDVGLRKPGVYVLNAAGRAAQGADTLRALAQGQRALLWFVLLACPVLLAVRQGVSGWASIASLLTSARGLS
jgi:adenosylcobinamide-phosphate synthase